MDEPQKLRLAATRWFVGNLAEAEFHSQETWVKWAQHQSGENSDATSGSPKRWKLVSGNQVSVLVRGGLTVELRAPSDSTCRRIELTDQGDGLFMLDGWKHRWYVTTDDTLVVTVRWKSE